MAVASLAPLHLSGGNFADQLLEWLAANAIDKDRDPGEHEAAATAALVAIQANRTSPGDPASAGPKSAHARDLLNWILHCGVDAAN